MKKLLLIFCIVVAQSPLFSQQDLTVRTSINRITRDVYVLASDSMGGRQFPQPGREMAARYIASEFERIGLAPIAQDGSSYFQKLRAEKTLRGFTRILSNGAWIRSGREFSFASTTPLNDSLTLPIRFYGRCNPPIPVCSDTIIHISDRSIEQALSRVRDLANASGRQTFAVSLPKTRRIHKAFIEREARSEQFRYPIGLLGMGAAEPKWLYKHLSGMPDSLSIFVFSSNFSNTLYAKPIPRLEKEARACSKRGVHCPSTIANLTFSSTFNIEYVTQFDDNVVGFLEGTDLKEELIIIGGHYDHLGTHDSIIYYGADDNASGTAAVMELARLCTQAKANGFEFRRSILFMAFGAEEGGLNGSFYYVANPLLPLSKTVLMINLDMIGRANQAGGAQGYAYLIPKQGNRNPLKRLIRSLDRQMDGIYFAFGQPGLEGISWHFGSDHYPFIHAGVPALVVTTGSHSDYHKPTDTPERINYRNMMSIIKALFAVTVEVANNPEQFPLRD